MYILNVLYNYYILIFNILLNMSNDIFHIIDNVYLSNIFGAHDLNLIEKNNITIVIRLSEDDNNKTIYNKKIAFINCEIEDNYLYREELIKLCKTIYEVIVKTPHRNILIHCNEGQSRSVSMIIYYLIKKYNYSYDKAFEYIQNIKINIHPNFAFVEELKKIQ